MSFVSDVAIRHLRTVADEPDLSATKYRLLAPIARGGMGTVYLAEDTELNRSVALKVLREPDPLGELAARLTAEARILARLEHPGIIPVHDVGMLPDGSVFYVMKHVRGRRLDEHAATLSEPADVLRIFQRLCEAVAFAHAHGVIHRDLKPQNIMVGEFGEVLVLDWGVARVLRQTEDAVGDTDVRDVTSPTPSAQGATLHGTRIGTPGYMAPEQVAGEITRMDERTDVYGLGAILAFLLARGSEDSAADDRSPLDRLEHLTPRPPRPLLAICARACAEDPADRYASAHELAADVNRFLQAQAVTAYRERPLERVGRFVARYRVAIILVATYMVLRVLFIVFAG